MCAECPHNVYHSSFNMDLKLPLGGCSEDREKIDLLRRGKQVDTLNMERASICLSLNSKYSSHCSPNHDIYPGNVSTLKFTPLHPKFSFHTEVARRSFWRPHILMYFPFGNSGTVSTGNCSWSLF